MFVHAEMSLITNKRADVNEAIYITLPHIQRDIDSLEVVIIGNREAINVMDAKFEQMDTRLSDVHAWVRELYNQQIE